MEEAAPMILAIDPGPKECGVLLYDRERSAPTFAGVMPTSMLIGLVVDQPSLRDAQLAPMYTALGHKRHETDAVIEMVAGYGMAVGAEVFETCTVIGHLEAMLQHVCGVRTSRLFRR